MNSIPEEIDHQAVIDQAIACRLPQADIYHVASELRKRKIYVTLNFGYSPNRNNINTLGGNSGGGRLGAIARSIYATK